MKEEMTALLPYEMEMRAAKADYLRSAGKAGIALMRRIYHRVTGAAYTETDACGHCQLKLQRYVADWYFQTMETLKEAQPKRKGGRK